MNIISGVEQAPRRILLYGVHGIGKSTWAASAPAPIFIQTEDGLGDVGCDRFPIATTFDAVLSSLREVYETKHNYRTLVLDSLDWLEKLIWAEVVGRKQVESIEDIAMHVILVAHAQIARFEDPEQESYDRYSPQLNKHAAALLTQWADEVLFATYRTLVKQTGEGFRKRQRAIGNGERILRTTERPAAIAKNRLGLPDELPFTKGGWAQYAQFLATNSKAGKKPAQKKETVNG